MIQNGKVYAVIWNKATKPDDAIDCVFESEELAREYIAYKIELSDDGKSYYHIETCQVLDKAE